MFRVPWVDDKGEVQVNRGFRVEMNSAIGPYKGGLRFHPTVNLGILKFLAFEQVFKNSLTTLPMGGGKGGSDFDPKGKSDGEVMRFCQSFMTELYRHIGPTPTCPPATSAWAAARSATCSASTSASRNEFTGVLTGKGLELGRLADPSRGHRLRLRLLRRRDARPRAARPSRARPASSPARATWPSTPSRRSSTSAASPSPAPTPAATSTTRPASTREARLRHGAQERQARPHQRVRRQVQERRLHARRQGERLNPLWDHKADVRLPVRDAERDQRQGRRQPGQERLYLVSEGANMPTVPEGVNVFVEKGILYGPGKAANAGGVATSGLEMSQNSLRLSLDARGGRRAPARHHEGHPPAVRRCLRGVRHAGQLRRRAPTSPASSRSPTPCSTRVSSRRPFRGI